MQPVWARTVIAGPAGSPLLYVGERDGQRAGVLAFLPRNSDLPLQVAFPLLMANLTGELLGGSAAPTEALEPGDPVSIPLPAGATSLKVTRPDGSVVELVPPTAGVASIAFSAHDGDQRGHASGEGVDRGREGVLVHHPGQQCHPAGHARARCLPHPGPDRATSGPERADPLRRRPVRSRGERHRARIAFQRALTLASKRSSRLLTGWR